MKQEHETTFVAVGERILGYHMVHQEAIELLRRRLPDGMMWPRKEALHELWQAALNASAEGRTISPETLSDATGASVDYLMNLQLSEARTTAAEIEDYVEILMSRGKRAASRRIGDQLRRDEIDLVDAIDAMNALETYGLRQRDTSAAALLQQFDDDIAKPPAKANPTGIGPIDVALWEMPVGKSTTVAAEYKGYKSRVLRNLILASSSRGARSFVVLAEGWVDEFTRECLVMIANQYLLRSKQWNDERNQPKLTGEYLSRSRAYLKNSLHKEALDVARRVYGQLPIRVWDGRDGANNPQAVLAEARSEARKYTSLIAVDYVQNMDFAGKELYNQMVNARKWLRAIRSLELDDPEKGVHVLIMSQKNEESIKSQGKNSGIKGGGELAQETDALLAPSHDEDIDATHFPDNPSMGLLKLPLRFSRVNRAMSMEFDVEVNSGVIVAYAPRPGDELHETVPVNIIPLKMLMPQRELLNQDDDLI